MSDNKLAKVDEHALSTKMEGGLNISGLEGIPTSDMPLPFYKFVGPTTEDKILADGTECPNYVFLNNATKEYYQAIDFRVLAMAKGKQKNFNDPTIMDETYSMVARNEANKELFLLSLRSTSLYDFRGMILNRMVKVAKETGAIYNLVITGKAKERSSTLDNGKTVKYQYAGFSIFNQEKTDKVASKELADLQATWKDYLLNREMEPSNTIEEAVQKGKAKVEESDEEGIDFDTLTPLPA